MQQLVESAETQMTQVYEQSASFWDSSEKHHIQGFKSVTKLGRVAFTMCDVKPSTRGSKWSFF